MSEPSGPARPRPVPAIRWVAAVAVLAAAAATLVATGWLALAVGLGGPAAEADAGRPDLVRLGATVVFAAVNVGPHLWLGHLLARGRARSRAATLAYLVGTVAFLVVDVVVLADLVLADRASAPFALLLLPPGLTALVAATHATAVLLERRSAADPVDA